jgi:hypothetical protein
MQCSILDRSWNGLQLIEVDGKLQERLTALQLTYHRSEVHDPWDPKSTFFKLVKANKELKAALPAELVLTSRNTGIHISCRTSRTYLLIHALHTLCTIALYREYMPFLPWECSRPEGPLDEPKIKGKLPEDQQNYWVDQARVCFGAAKDFADLLKACQSANALVETPMAGWATYIVAWSGKPTSLMLRNNLH